MPPLMRAQNPTHNWPFNAGANQKGAHSVTQTVASLQAKYAAKWMWTGAPLRAEPALCTIYPAAATLPFRNPPPLRRSAFCRICPAAAIRFLQNQPHCDDPSFAESAPPLRRSAHRKNKKSNFFATFLRLRTLLRLREANNGRFTTDHLRFCVLICD